MNNLEVFNYNRKEIRTIQKNGEVWWVLKDVCDVLDIKNPTDVAKRLDDDEVTRFNLGGLSGETNIINESGLYNVILRSDKPEAKKFKRWVTHEVLPSIRNNRMYIMNENQQSLSKLGDIENAVKSLNQDIKQLKIKEYENSISFEVQKKYNKNVLDILNILLSRAENFENGGKCNESVCENKVKEKKRRRNALFTIERHPKEIQEKANELLDDLVIYEEIARIITDMGYPVSRSSIGRYALKRANGEI